MDICKHCLGISSNEIGEAIAFCEIWDSGRNITLGECFENCEDQEPINRDPEERQNDAVF